MGRPSDEFDAMYDWVGVVIRDIIRDTFTPEAKILDVGAGWGKFAKLLPEYSLDACEVWKPYQRTLKNQYNEVFISDICDLEFDHYDVIIMSEVLEHIERPKAQKLIQNLVAGCNQLLVSVPYLHPQGEVGGNPYEVHKQDNLTPSLISKHYPELEPVLELKKRGLYERKKI